MMTKLVRRFWRDEDGATLVEYGIALIIAITVGGGLLSTLATNTDSNFTDANDAVVGN